MSTSFSPGKQMAIGGAVMGGAVALAFVFLVMTGRLYIYLLLAFFGGLVIFARGAMA